MLNVGFACSKNFHFILSNAKVGFGNGVMFGDLPNLITEKKVHKKNSRSINSQMFITSCLTFVYVK